MRHAKITTITALIAVTLPTACETEHADTESTTKLVVEGNIDNDGTTEVILTSSLIPTTDGGNMADNLIRWGKITVSDGSSTVILTGGPRAEGFPPYHYFNHSMFGHPGRTYTITVEYDGLTASSSCTMPAPTPIDKLELHPIENNDTLRALTMLITAPDDCPAYYHIVTRVNDRDSGFYPAMFGTFEATLPGEHITVPVYRGKHDTSPEDYVADMPIGTTVTVKLCRVEKSVHDFWLAYENVVYFGGSQFISAAGSLPTNITGGYGVWNAQGTASATIAIE